jgi:DNA-binding NarL/FixJ family response regulator
MLLERERIEVIGEASDGLEAIDIAARLHPDVLVVDLAMPALSGIGAVKEIARVSPQTRSILLTMYTEEHHILDALRAGVRGCVSKTQAAEHLLEAIRAVQAGDVYLSPSVSGAIVQAYLAKADPTPDPLTGRERQVLHLIAEGKTTKEIAGILGVTPKTVETHRAKLMEKLDIHGTAGLVRYAIRQGLLQP